MSGDILLDVQDLRTSFFTDDGEVKSVDGVSFQVRKGETVALVGESGCGKSVTSYSIMGLVSKPGRIVDGSINFEGKDLTKIPNHSLQKIRGNEISMIFQEPLTSLNPLFSVGFQISEVLIVHKKLSKKQAKERSIELLKEVGIPRADKVFDNYPHDLSGGMRQRVMIAMALACNPKLLIADEPTTALDVTIQKQILYLMRKLSRSHDTSIIVITHDLGVVAELADRVVVMYAGKVVEENDVYSLFENPKHPYTKGLLNSTPDINNLNETLISIEGTVPDHTEMPIGCRFHPRCEFAHDRCRQSAPPLLTTEDGTKVRCWLYEEEGEPNDSAQSTGSTGAGAGSKKLKEVL